MSTLDLRTVFVVYAATGFVCAAMILTLWRRNRHRYPGLGFLVSVIVIQAAGTLFIALRGSVPDWLSIMVANCLVAGSLFVAYLGLERLVTRGDRELARYVLLADCALFVAFVVIQAHYVYMEPRLDARVLNTSSIQLLFSAQCMWLLTREARPGRRVSVAIIAGVFGGYCLIDVARIIAVVAGAYGASDYMDSGLIEPVFLLLYLLLLILFAYSITLMVNELLSTVVDTQEEKFTKAFRSVPTAVLMTRVSTGEIVEVNDAFCSITGYGMDEAVGKTTVGLGLWPEDARAEFRDGLLQNGRVRDKEYVFRRKSGDLFAGMLSAEVISMDGEQMILSAVADIEERKRSAERLRESEEQLLQAQKMEAVGQLAGGIAHDFNNLLGVIMGYNDLACAELSREDSGPAEYLGQVRNAAERASALTKQMLAFSRKQTLRPVVLSLNDVIRDIEPLLGRTLGEGVELRMDLTPDLASVEADRHQLEQVLMNLALNSVDAMSSGGTLTVRTGNLPARGRSAADARAAEALGRDDLVALTVADTGEGMSGSTLQRVFEPFFTTKAPGSGSGLGMSVVYGVVTQSRGHIEVESEPGDGTMVHIYLPRVEATVAVPDEPGLGLPGVQGTETILVVEDESALRELVARVLGEIGYEVMVAATGSEALAVAQAADASFDLLLTDVVLPGDMQGNDLVKTLRETRLDLPVLYMSGYPRDSIVRAGRLEEGVNLIEKPFTQAVLAAAIREVLDKPLPRPL